MVVWILLKDHTFGVFIAYEFYMTMKYFRISAFDAALMQIYEA
jgi:hypothetical protein